MKSNLSTIEQIMHTPMQWTIYRLPMMLNVLLKVQKKSRNCILDIYYCCAQSTAARKDKF